MKNPRYLSVAVFLGGLALALVFWLGLRTLFPALSRFGVLGDLGFVTAVFSAGFLAKALIDRYFYLD